MPEVEEKENKEKMDFEAKQNATGFFSLLLKVAKRNPELWKQICNENNENNRDTNNPDKT
jgi:prephenate dehydrogenase